MEEKKLTPQAKFEKEKCTRVSIKLVNHTDADIIAHLERQPNKQGYIKALIRDDMEVSEYVIVYKWEDKIQRMELQALSAQNVVDMFRNLYGTEIRILEVHKVMEDWH